MECLNVGFYIFVSGIKAHKYDNYISKMCLSQEKMSLPAH